MTIIRQLQNQLSRSNNYVDSSRSRREQSSISTSRNSQESLHPSLRRYLSFRRHVLCTDLITCSLTIALLLTSLLVVIRYNITDQSAAFLDLDTISLPHLNVVRQCRLDVIDRHVNYYLLRMDDCIWPSDFKQIVTEDMIFRSIHRHLFDNKTCFVLTVWTSQDRCP